MTLPGSKTITYSYDEVGRLVGLTAWGNQHSDFHYDKAGRHVGTQRPNGLLSDYAYDPASRLRRVRHRAGSSLRGQFNYTVDGRGNRTRAYERVAQSTTVTNTLTKTDTAVTFTRGTWTDDGAYKKTTQFSGRMQIAYTGDEALLTVGVGPDHGIIDISINDNYWRRFDAYATTPAERVIHLPQVPTPPGETTGTLEIRNHSDRHRRSTGHVFRFKQLAVIDTTYADTTIDYTYDALSRLQQANYNTGQRIYDYNFDLAGNRIQEALSGTSVTAKTTDYTYNTANQLTNDGAHTLTYDPNGNLMSDGTNTYTWDRANRMLIAPNNTSYKYDGLGNRISQSIGTTATNYLLDLQPGLTKVIAATTETNTNHYIHAPQGSNVPGIHAMQTNAGEWSYMAQDGLGSVRSLINSTLGVDTTQSYNPYGVPDGNYGTGFAFTGEQTDANGQLYLRARYYNPGLGVFPSLDPFEGSMGRPMSLNGYSWVEGNVLNKTDPSGMQPITPEEMQRIFQEAERLAMELARGSGGVITEQILRQALRQALAQYGHLTSPQLEGQAVQHLTSTAVLARFGAAGLITSALIPTTRDGRICNAYNRTITNNCLPDLSRYWALNYEPQYQIQTGVQSIITDTECLIISSPQTSPATASVRSQTQTQKRRYPGGCKSMQNQTQIGSQAHDMIQAWFTANHPDSRAEYPIPNAGIGGNVGFADLVLFNESSYLGVSELFSGIYEIKSSNILGRPADLEAARQQRDRYVTHFSKSNMGGQARPGIYWEPSQQRIGDWPDHPDQELVVSSYYQTWPDSNGLVFYWCRNKR